jgi:hypothetical protein
MWFLKSYHSGPRSFTQTKKGVLMHNHPAHLDFCRTLGMVADIYLGACREEDRIYYNPSLVMRLTALEDHVRHDCGACQEHRKALRLPKEELNYYDGLAKYLSRFYTSSVPFDVALWLDGQKAVEAFAAQSLPRCTVYAVLAKYDDTGRLLNGMTFDLPMIRAAFTRIAPQLSFIAPPSFRSTGT